MLIFEVMKQLKLVSTLLSVVFLGLSVWSIAKMTNLADGIVEDSLNFIYFVCLFIVCLSFRISLGYSQRVNFIIALLSIVLICLSTYTWVYPAELLVVGKITLGMVPLLIGTSLMFVLKSSSKWSKGVQLTVGTMSAVSSSCVFLGVSSHLLYSILFVGFILTLLVALIFLLFEKAS